MLEMVARTGRISPGSVPTQPQNWVGFPGHGTGSEQVPFSRPEVDPKKKERKNLIPKLDSHWMGKNIYELIDWWMKLLTSIASTHFAMEHCHRGSLPTAKSDASRLRDHGVDHQLGHISRGSSL